MPHFDDLETRSADARAADQTAGVIAQIARVRAAEGACLPGDAQVTCLEDLPKLPVLRKSDLVRWQTEKPPFGGIPVTNAAHVFQSPGPIYEPGGVSHDWWRMGRFLFAAGIGAEDVVQNCFGYHLTPAGMIFENGARAVGARVLPAGTGQTELQVQAARDVGSTAYAGTPDYLKTILDKADEMGVALKIAKAAVSGGALFPSLRAAYKDRGITCLQCYATADLGNIAYESAAMEGMIVDEGVIVEIVRPGTGDPVADGEVGEVVVTTLNGDYPLIRFGTGDLSAVLSGPCPTGRTGRRIKGWLGRADQTAKVRGMFVHPSQVAEVLKRHPELQRARLVIEGEMANDRMSLRVEARDPPEGLAQAVAQTLRDVTKLRGEVSLLAPGSLPNDGKVIEDLRRYD